MIKNIILDMGNVLLNFNPEVPLEEFCSSDAEKDIVRNELFKSSEWVQADKGEIKTAELFDLVKVRVPKENWDALKNCCEKWDICMVPIAGAVDFCKKARADGYGVYVLSNASDLFYRYFESNFLPISFFDGVVVSSDIKMLKPDREIYEYILKKYDLVANECLFVDDLLHNVEGAKAVGMNAVQFKGDYSEIWSAVENSFMTAL